MTLEMFENGREMEPNRRPSDFPRRIFKRVVRYGILRYFPSVDLDCQNGAIGLH
jgi:hypothetical protein